MYRMIFTCVIDADVAERRVLIKDSTFFNGIWWMIFSEAESFFPIQGHLELRVLKLVKN